jgi:homogentisate 1,2-dioxygenase
MIAHPPRWTGQPCQAGRENDNDVEEVTRRMAYYQQRGSVPPKRHTQHRGPEGHLYFEELMGEEGFSSDSSLLYHREIPSALLEARMWELPDQTTVPNEPLLPRHLLLHGLFGSPEAGVDVVTGRRLVLGNDDVRISYAAASEPSPLYRNAVGDECVYLESGSATVETVFGVLNAREGDYVLIPRATTHRWLPGPDGVRAYCIEANSHITPARRYLSKFGQLLEHAPYCERDLHGPSAPPYVDTGPVEVYVKHRGSGPGGLAGSVHVVPHHPFDVVGWDGCLYPYTFNVADFEPITGRVHQPPPVHQVFEGNNFVICNFVPRKVDYHPLSIPVPYYHSNVDSDEVMFYCGGDYEARKGSGIGQGSISLHPGGHSHGPQPGAYERSIGVEYFDELAVMVDTFRPLRLGEGGRAADDGRYAWSWNRP